MTSSSPARGTHTRDTGPSTLEPVYDRWGVRVYHDDCLDVLREMPDCSVHSVVTDPPAGIAFMSKSWDANRGGRDRWVEWLTDRMEQAFRVLKPGGYALVWAMPRTSHWTAWALENAGFEIRDCLVHLYGSGFPKSLDVSQVIDKAAGAEREIVGTKTAGASSLQRVSRVEHGYRNNLTSCTPDSIPVTAAATDTAQQWDGWGTALKPAAEHWWLCRKPLSGTVASNVLKHGTGALNIDACRVGRTGGDRTEYGRGNHLEHHGSVAMGRFTEVTPYEPHTAGRWPTNVVFTHAPLLDPETREVLGDACAAGCVPGCPVAELDAQSGTTSSWMAKTNYTVAPTNQVYGKYSAQPVGPQNQYGDSGGASRFFPVFRWEAKAPTHERPRVNGRAHPTVKPRALMRWMTRLITPPGGTVLDLFAGTGTTGQACIMEGFQAILIENDPDSIPLIKARLDARPRDEAPRESDDEPRDLLDLIDGGGLMTSPLPFPPNSTGTQTTPAGGER